MKKKMNEKKKFLENFKQISRKKRVILKQKNKSKFKLIDLIENLSWEQKTTIKKIKNKSK